MIICDSSDSDDSIQKGFHNRTFVKTVFKKHVNSGHLKL